MSDPAVLVGRYEIGEAIGRGGMAEVHRGRDQRLGRTVAVKMLRVDLLNDPTFQERFRREAQSAASLNHPNIVAVYDTGEDTFRGVRVPFIVMEYVEGYTLREVIRDGDPITHQRALEIVAGTCDALEYSHRAGIVHRDIKPGNVMLTETGQVKVMDFGIARAMGETGQTMTQTSMVVGTAQYLSPEQARGETADARSDLYATGCVLYELLVGQPPFVGDSLVSIAMSHVKDPPRPPSASDPSISADVDAIVLMALAKDRNDRYQSAGEMGRDIHRALSGVPVEAAGSAAALAGATAVVGASTFLSPAEVAAAAAAEQGGTATGIPQTNPHPVAPTGGGDARKTGYGSLIAGVLLVAALAGGLGYWLFSGDSPQQVRIPEVAGKQVDEAERLLDDAGFTSSVTEETSTTEAAGIVISSDPDSGQLLAEGENVALVVSAGAEQVVIPRVGGRDIAEARASLELLDLLVETKSQASDRPSGEVLSADPPEGSSVDVGSTVTLTVSSGDIEVPNVVGQTEAAATATLTQAGFDVRSVTEERADATAGQVVAQTPAAGALAKTGTRVVITVAVAPDKPVETPAPTSTPADQSPTTNVAPTDDSDAGAPPTPDVVSISPTATPTQVTTPVP